jgi:hypothetical protein
VSDDTESSTEEVEAETTEDVVAETRSAIDDIDGQIEFLQMIRDAAVERQAAYEVRESDPARWKEAKQKFTELRSSIRKLREERDGVDASVTPSVVEGSAALQGSTV